MMATFEDPATLRRKAEKCERLADGIPSWADAERLRAMAAEYRDAAQRLEGRASEDAGVPVRPA